MEMSCKDLVYWHNEALKVYKEMNKPPENG